VQYVLAQDPPEVIPPELLPGDIMRGTMELRAGRLKDMVRIHERMLVTAALQACSFNVTATAAKLGLTRMGLTKKIATLGIKTPTGSSRRFPKRMGRGNRARIEIIEISPAAVPPGGKVAVKLRISNTGRTPWLDISRARQAAPAHRGRYVAQVEWFPENDPAKLIKTEGIPLAGPVRCGETAIVDGSIKALTAPGRYTVLFVMHQVGVGSFMEKPTGNNSYNQGNFPTAAVTILGSE
ncbi:MAG TPA: helix-turn-helix domain-containing protein, partial [Candidatus Edwardsbacteria bacterium]|nr:helix-turn-helix domain-containing protein [Candidatus Edwardsbacteria bacterium]